MKNLILISILLFTFNSSFSQEKLKLYSQAPDFQGIDQYGNEIALTKALKEGPVVLFFYRGQWCPHCNKQMSNLQDSIKYINKLGARVIAITPEKTDNIALSVLKTDAKFSIIYDEGHKIMDSYKVTYKLGYAKHLAYSAVGININTASGNDDRALPVPATYIIEKNGRIIGSHFNEDYSKRMPASEIIKILEIRSKSIIE